MKHILILFFLVTFTLANIGKVSTVVGDANIQRGDKSIIATVGLIIKEKDIIHTKRNAKVQLIFKDNTVITLGKNSSLDIDEYLYDTKNPKKSKTNFNFFKGAFKTISGKIGKINREKFKLRTKNATVGIRGTIILGNQQVIACTQGGITVQSSGQFVQVDANELTVIKENEAPSKPKNITSNELTNLENQLEPDAQTQDSSTTSSEEKEENSESNEETSTSDETQSNESESTQTTDNEESSTDTESKNEETSSSESDETQTNTQDSSSNDTSDANSETTQTEEESSEKQIQDNINDSIDSSSSSAQVDDQNTNIDPLQNESISNNTLQTQNALEGEDIAEGTAEEVAAQKQAEEQKVFVETTEEIKVATQEIQTLKADVQTAQEETTKTLESLPTTEQVTTLQTSSTTALTETKQEVNTAVDTLKETLDLNTLQAASTFTFSRALFSFQSTPLLTTSSTSETKTPQQLEEEAKKALSDIEAFIATQDATKNQQALVDAKVEVDKAKSLLEDSETKLNTAKTALQDAQNKGISSSLIDSIQKEVDTAQAAYDEVNTLYTTAKNLYDSKMQALQDLDTSLANAQEAVKQATLLVEIDNLKNSLTTIKDANTNANTNKDLTNTSSSESTVFIDKLTKTSDTETLKTQTQTAQTTTQTSINTAITELNKSTTNSVTDEILTNISNLVTQSNTNNDLLTQANAMKSSIVTSDNLNSLTNAKAKLDTAEKQLGSTKTNFDLAQTELDKIKASLTTAKNNDTNSLITSDIETTLLSKAQSDYDSALAAYTQAKSSYDSAKATYEDRQTAYDNAVASVVSAQEAVNDAVLLGKLSELLTKIDNGSDAKANTDTYKTQTTTSSTQANSLVSNLIQSSETTTLKTQTETAQTTTQTSVNTTLTELQSATTNSITDETLTNISSLVTQSNTNNDLLTQANAMKSDIVTSENLSSLNSAKIKLDESLNSLQKAEDSLQKAEDSLNEVKNLFTDNASIFENEVSSGLQNSLEKKAKADYDSALAAYTQAKSSYDSAKATYDDRQTAYDNAVASVTSAQEAVNDAVLLGKLSELLTKIDNSSDAKIETDTYKTQTTTSSTQANSLISNLIQSSETTTLKTQTQTAQTTTQTSVNTTLTELQSATTNSITDETLANISSLVTQSNTNNDLLTQANAMKSDIVTSENLSSLNSAKTKLYESSVSLDNTLTSLKNAQQALSDIKDLFTINANTFENEVSSELQNSLVLKAQADYDSALAAYTQARSSYDNAKATYEDRQTAYDNAVASVVSAQEAVNDAVLLGKLSELLTTIDNGSDAKVNTDTYKTQTTTSSTQANSLVSNLIQSSETTTLKTQTETAQTTTQTSVNTTLTELQSATTNSITDETLTNISSLVTQSNTNNDLLTQANAMKSDIVTSENLSSLNSAKTKLYESSVSLDNTLTSLKNAQQALSDIKDLFTINANTFENEVSSELQNSLIAKAQADYDSALTAYNEAKSSYDSAKATYEDRQTAYDNAVASVVSAQEAVNDAVLLGKLSELLTKIDNGSDAKIETDTYKTNTITAKNETTTIVNTLPSDADITAVKTNATNAVTQTNSSIDSALTLLSNSTQTESVNATDISSLNSTSSTTTTSNNTILTDTQAFKNSVDNEYKLSLDNAQVKATLAKQQLDQTKVALDKTKQALADFNSSLTSNASTFEGELSTSLQTSLKQKLENEVALAQASYDAALIASNDAQTLVDSKRTALNDAANISIEAAQDAVQQATTLAKLADMLEYIDNGNKASVNADTYKTTTESLTSEATTKINTLPTSDEINSVVTKSESSLTSSTTTQDGLVSAINSAVSNANVDNTTLTDLQSDITSITLVNNDTLQEAKNFQTKVNGEYKTVLDEANAKVQQSKTSYDNAQTELDKAIDAYDNMLDAIIALNSGYEFDPNEEEVPFIDGEVIVSSETTQQEESVQNLVISESLANSLMQKLHDEVDEAREAYLSAKEAYDNALSLYNSKKDALDNAAEQSVADAQASVDLLVLLNNLEAVLDALENTKQAKIDVISEKNTALSEKTNTSTSISSAQTASDNIDTYNDNASTASVETQTATTEALNAYNIANNSETEDVEIAYSAQKVRDQAAIARTKANLAKQHSDSAISEYNKVKTKVEAAETHLGNALAAKNKAITKLAVAKDHLDDLIAAEKKIPAELLAVKKSVEDALQKAQEFYALATSDSAAATKAYNNAKTAFDNLKKDEFIAAALAAKDEAVSNSSGAETNAQSAESNATLAIELAKQASTRVKTRMTSANNKRKFIANDTEDTIDLENKVFELSGYKTKVNLLKSAIINYVGHSQLGVYKENENSTNPLYLVQADNLLEFFIGYSDTSNSNKTLFTYGLNNGNNFDLTKTNIYKSYKTLTVNADGSRVLSDDVKLAYYNPVTDSYTEFKKDIYKTGATKFVAGNNGTVVSLENSFDFKSSSKTFINGVNDVDGTGTNDFFGSVEQGLTQTLDKDKIVVDSPSVDVSEEISGSFLNGQTKAVDVNSTKTMSGKTVLIYHSDTVAGQSHGKIDLTISKSTNSGIHILADSKYENGNTIEKYGGYTKDNKAYYINDDIFGVKVEEGAPGENGFLMAVPDGGYNEAGEFVMFDEDDNPFTSDDGSSWGYWSGKDNFHDGNDTVSISPLATWVAGEKVSTGHMDALMSTNATNQTLQFNGKVLGTIGYSDPILMDSTNKVRIDFEVGGGAKNMTGNMQFKSASSSLYNLDLAIDSSNITNSQFSGGFKPAGNSSASTSGYIKGEYYGDSNSLKSVGGSFQYGQANGVFKATKK